MPLRLYFCASLTEEVPRMELLYGVGFACVIVWLIGQVVGGPKVDLDE